MANKPRKTKISSRVLRLPFKEREFFTENLGLLLKAAVPIEAALASIESTIKSRAFKKALQGMRRDIEAGYSLSDALEHSRIVGRQTLALVRLGEASGNLVEDLEIAAKEEEKHHHFVSKVRSAFIYPAFVITLTIVIGLGVAWFLLPRLSETFAQLNVTLPPISQALINFGLFLKEHGIIAVPAAIGGILLLGYVLFVMPGTNKIGKKIMLHAPGIGRLVHEVEIAQFGYLLGTLLNAGLPITKALLLVADTSSMPDYQKLYRHLAQSIDNGFTFKESMEKYKHSSKLLPLAVQQMVIAGERSGSLSTVLLTIGHNYEQKSDTTTQNLETIVEPVLLVAVAGGVMLVAVAVILPIYSLIGGLNE